LEETQYLEALDDHLDWVDTFITPAILGMASTRPLAQAQPSVRLLLPASKMIMYEARMNYQVVKDVSRVLRQ